MNAKEDEPTLADHAMHIYGQVRKAKDDALATDIIYCDMVKRTNQTIEDVKGKENELLNEYSKFLEENGYLDTDWRAEEPFAIDEFKKSDQYKEWCSILEKLKI